MSVTWSLSEADRHYRELLGNLLDHGEEVTTRNSKVRRLYPVTYRFTRTPLISLRRTAWKNALREMEWFLSGSNNVNDLHPSVRPWWQPWANDKGIVPFNYSRQFRQFFGANDSVDQIEYLIDGLRDHPFSRRLFATTWNAADMTNYRCPITNCHGSAIQFFVDKGGYLHLVTYQRSVDVLCGLPHNLIQYWALCLWLVKRSELKGIYDMTWIGGDVHLYDCHGELAQRLLCVKKSPTPRQPELVYTPTSSDFKADDFSLDREYLPILTDRAEMVV